MSVKIKRMGKNNILVEGKFIRFLKKGHWEYVQRNNCSGVVVILALTKERKVIFVEQFRVPVGKRVIEFPAGLANDIKHIKNESLVNAAKRELFEETGYKAKGMKWLTAGPAGSGLSSEVLTLYLAKDIKKIGEGGGDAMESIQIHEVPIKQVETWLRKKEREGCLVDPKIYAGLYFLNKYHVK